MGNYGIMAEEKTPALARGFPTTRASAILGLHSDDPSVRARSLEQLAALYWRPVYKYLRLRWRKSPDEAQEITQEFFLHSIDAGVFAKYDPERAHFRTFLRVCLDRFVVDLARQRLTKKRGEGMVPVPFDVELLEREIHENGDASDPDRLFEEEWVRSLVGIAVESLRAACEANGKQEHFRVFERYYLSSREEPSYADIAAELQLSHATVMNRLAYARREFRAVVLETLHQLTGSERELRAEARIVLGIDLEPKV